MTSYFGDFCPTLKTQGGVFEGFCAKPITLDSECYKISSHSPYISTEQLLAISNNVNTILELIPEDKSLVIDHGIGNIDKKTEEVKKQLEEKDMLTELLKKVQELFYAGWCDDEAGKAAIRRVWENHHYLCDTHTASGWAVAEDYVNQTGDNRPMVVLSTASAYKFPTAVLEALQVETACDEFDQMLQLSRLTGTAIPGNLRTLREKPERHTGVIEKEKMLSFVLDRCK